MSTLSSSTYVDNGILRLGDNRLIKHTLRMIYDNPQEGDILMDARDQTWEQLLIKAKADDKKLWWRKVMKLKQLARRSTQPPDPKKQAHCPRSDIKAILHEQEQTDHYTVRGRKSIHKDKSNAEIHQEYRQYNLHLYVSSQTHN